MRPVKPVKLALAIASATALGLGCAAHDDGPEPSSTPVALPAVIQEAEPKLPLPPIVAPALPTLAPTRPLANLALMWRHTLGQGPPPATVWAVGTRPIAMAQADATSLGLPGVPGDLSTLTPPAPWPFHAAGPLLLLNSELGFMALERGSNEVRWSTQELPNGRSYDQFVSPRALVANYYLSDADRLMAWALDDGRQLWTRRGEGDTDFTRIKKLWTDGARGYFISDAGLFAFDPNTGASLWSTPLAESGCGAATEGGVVVVEDPGGHRVLDPELGAEIARLPALGAKRCAWESYAYDSVIGAAIEGGRLYAFDSQPSDTGASPLRAFALDTGRELWKAEGFGDDLLVVDHDAVFVAREGQVLLALDATTGQVSSQLSIGLPFTLHVAPVGGAAGPYVVIEDEQEGTWILGRDQTTPTPEAYEIRAQLVPLDGMPKRRLGGVRMRVGEQVVKTDKRGRLRAKGSARGALIVEQADEYGQYDPDEWTQVIVDPQRVILDGKGSYDLGELPAYEASME